MKKLLLCLMCALVSILTWGGDAPAEDQQEKKKEMASGMIVHLDQNRTPNQDIPPEIREALNRLIITSDEGLIEQRRGDGSVVLHLNGRYQSAVVAVIGKDGKPQTTCVSQAPRQSSTQSPDSD